MSLINFSETKTETSKPSIEVPNVDGFTNRADCYAHWNDKIRVPVNGVIVDECARLPY